MMRPLHGWAIVGGEGEFDGEGVGAGGVAADDGDAKGGIFVAAGEGEVEVDVGVAVELADGTMPGDDFQRPFYHHRRQTTLRHKIIRRQLHFVQPAEQLKGGGVDVVRNGRFCQRLMDIHPIGEGAHEDAGAVGVNLAE